MLGNFELGTGTSPVVSELLEESFNDLVTDIVAGAKDIRRAGYSYQVLGEYAHTVVVHPVEGEVVDEK